MSDGETVALLGIVFGAGLLLGGWTGAWIASRRGGG